MVMAYSNRPPLTLVVVVVVVAVVIVGSGQGPTQVRAQAQGCRGLDIGGLVSKCGRYVQKAGPKIVPSPACCGVVKNIDIPCACKYVSKDVEKLVSVEKAVYVIRYCGHPLKRGSKCGSYTIPPGSGELFHLP